MIDLQAAVTSLDAAKDAKIAASDADWLRVAPGELGVPSGKARIPWDKTGYRGHPLDLSGYHETFREDFTDITHVTDETGNGPIYAPVHTDFGNVKFRKPSENTGTYTIVDGKLRIRMEKIGAQWWSGHISTLTRDGRGFSQAMGAVEWRYSLPSGGTLNGAPGYWGGGWNLSANEFIPSIGGFLFEADLQENYGGDAKGLHSTIHKKAKLVPDPGDFLQAGQRETLSNYTDLKGAKYTDNPTVLMYPGDTWNPMDDNQHTVTDVLDEDWWTIYWDGLSICRYPTLEFMKTPRYMNFSSILQNGFSSIAVGPQDAYIDYVRALAKT
jgi:hypothetical protein